MTHKHRNTGRNRGRKLRMKERPPQMRAAADEQRPGDGQTTPTCCGRAIGMTVATRRQTTQEQRRFEAALELLLTEMVRQETTGRRTDTE